MRRTPLKRKTPLRGYGDTKRRRAPDDIPPWVREAVDRRSGGRCEYDLGGRCRDPARQMHHKLMRSQGGKHFVENLLHVCVHHHRWIHDHPAMAYELGYLIRRGA